MKLFVLVFIIPFLANAHESASLESHNDGPEAHVFGSVELRPTLVGGDVFGENVFDLGYQFSRKFQMAYSQEVHHNIRLAEEEPEHEGLGLHTEMGVMKAHLHDLYQSTDDKTSFSIEPRVYLPTSSEDREKGFQTAGASQFILKHQLSENVNLALIDSPTLFAYSARGATVGEEYAANPIFQNLSQLAMNVSLTSKLSISLPLLVYLTKHYEYEPEAEHNGAWTTILSVAPEIGYEVASGFSTGLAFTSPNLLDSELSDHCVNHGRTVPGTQLVVRATL